MKLTIFCLALTVAALPVAAQTIPAQTAIPAQAAGTAQAHNPKAMHDLALQLFQAGENVHHHDYTPQQKAREAAALDRVNDLTHAGTEALHNKNFIAAEADYRELVQVDALSPNSYYGLGEALAGQGKTAEATAAYRTAVYYPLNFTPEAVAISQAIENKPNLRGCSFPVDAVAWMKYALLLSQTRQNAEAFSVYSQAMRQVNDPDRSGITLFSAGGPQSPSEFQSAVHIALGLLIGGMLTDHEQAMSEFDQALRLAPDAAVTNYYYGYGWQRLDPKSSTRAATALQAKAALAKAEASGNDSIKKAAAEALKRVP